MVNPTPQLALSRPPRDSTLWDVDINSNSDKLDAIFDPSTGHAHNGSTGQGPRIPLGNLSGVALATPTTGQLLRFDGTNWVNAAAPPQALSQQTDVTITSPTSGQILTYNGTVWVNSAPPPAALSSQTDVNITSPANLQILQFQTSDNKWHNVAPPPQALAGQTDVNISSPANLQILQFQTLDNKWHNVAPPPQALAGQTDVNITSPSNGQSLVYDTTTSKWINGRAGHVIQDEGNGLVPRTYLNFIGSGITATDNPGLDSTDILVPGTSGGSGIVQNMDAIQTIVLGADQTAIEFTNIPQNYRHLKVVYNLRWSTGAQRMVLRFNDDIATNYDGVHWYINHANTMGSQGGYGQSFAYVTLVNGTDGPTLTSASNGTIDIPDYARNTTLYKGFSAMGFTAWSGAPFVTQSGCNWRSTVPITKIALMPEGMNANGVAAGSVVTLYGVRDAATTGQLNSPETINATIDGGGLAISTGIKADLEIPFDCKILYVTLLADQIGSVTLDVRKSSLASWPTVSSIMGTHLPAIVSAQKSQTMNDASWSQYLSAGDILQLYVPNPSSYITRLSVGIKVTRL